MTGAFCGLILYLKESSGLLLVCCFCQVSYQFFLLYFENHLLYLNVCCDVIWENNPDYIFFFQEPTWPIVVVMLVPTKNLGSKLKRWLWKISSKFKQQLKTINWFQTKYFSSHLTQKNHYHSHLSNSRGGGNKRGGGANVVKINEDWGVLQENNKKRRRDFVRVGFEKTISETPLLLERWE